MDLSFPCVGNLDDGIFHDLGLEDETRHELRDADSSKDGPDPLQSIVLSPDALDLALMAFDLKEEERVGADTHGRGEGDNSVAQSAHSPFCDAAITQQDRNGGSPVCAAVSPTPDRRATRDSDRKGADALIASRKVHLTTTTSGVAFSQAPMHQQESFDSGGDDGPGNSTSSPRLSPTRWPPPKEKRGLGTESKACISKAFPPRLPDDDSKRGAPVSKTHTKPPPLQRGVVEARSPSRRFAAQVQSCPSQADSIGAKPSWACHGAAPCESAVVAKSVRKEEEALAEANHAIDAAGAPDTCSRHWAARRDAPAGAGPAREKRKVSFADEFARVQAEEENAADGDDRREWRRMTDDTFAGEEGGRGGRGGGGAASREGGPDEGDGERERVEGGAQSEDDLLARASELHSSVAGQLRSVNELLKRKSYFYIDTSWSAKQLPCPPTAWKGKGVGGGAGAATGGANDSSAGMGSESSSSTKPRHRSTALPADARNFSVRLEGRWMSAGSKKPRVGMHSIVGEKVIRTNSCAIGRCMLNP